MLYCCWGAFIYGLKFRSSESADEWSKNEWKVKRNQTFCSNENYSLAKHYSIQIIILTFTWDLVDIIVRAIGGCCCCWAECKWISWLPISCWVRHIIIISNVISVVSECVAQSRSSFLDWMSIDKKYFNVGKRFFGGNTVMWYITF